MEFNIELHKRGSKSSENRTRSHLNEEPRDERPHPSQKFLKSKNHIKTSKARPKQRELIPSQFEEYKEGELRHDLRSQPNLDDDIDLMCLHEDLLEIKDTRPSSNKNQKGFGKEWNPRLPSEMQSKGLFQNYKDLFPYDLQSNNPNEHPLEVKNYLEQRPSSYWPRKVPKPQVKSILPGEPYMKITVLRACFDKNVTIEYYVTPRGMVNSNRNTDHDDIMIGRQQATPDNIVPNDVCLFYSDRIISRVHCKIITKYGFKLSSREISADFWAFLMMSHKRLGARSPGYNLPGNLYRYIYSFIKEPRKFWLVDLGSSFGTYVKLKPELIYPLERGQTYLVGSDTLFNIADVRNIEPKEEENGPRNERVKFGEQDDFLKFLLQEKVHKKCVIHGISETEKSQLELMVNAHQEQMNADDTSFIETERSPPCFRRPYLKLEIQNSGGIHTAPNHLLIGNFMKEFTVGRTQECDVNLSQNTAVSRKQCRFVCHDGIWFIADGTQAKKSANGTWLSLTDYRLKRERLESEPREIYHGTEIKISDTVLQIEIHNNQ